MKAPTFQAQTRKAINQGAYRARRRQGVRVYGIEISDDTVKALIDRGWLSEAGVKDSRRVADAVSDLIDCWYQGTLTCDSIK